MGSTRLPGKVLKDIGGESMLARVVRRAQRATLLDDVVVATTVNQADEAIIEECRRLGVSAYRGSEEDALDRYYQASKFHRAETVVRITSDCPLIDPDIVGQLIEAFLDKQPDYASNCLRRTYPRGLDAEVITAAALGRAWREAAEPHERVHVSSYIYQRPEQFDLLSVEGDADFSDYRWTVDTSEDLDFVRLIYARLGNRDTFSWNDILDVLSLHPELMEMNRHVRQKSLHEG